jgi:hypothetical protein
MTEPTEPTGSITGMSDVELFVRRQGTLEMIAGNSTIVSLQRPSFVDDGAGGERPGPVQVVLPQTFRIIALNRDVPRRISADGSEVQPSYRLLGRWNADVERGDFFVRDGVRYEVVWVEPDKLDATRAELVYGT